MEDLSQVNHRKQPELLAPAGSFDTCKAVIHAGADAVYLGGSRFGARAYADNLTREELLEAIDYAHLYSRKIFLTVNTLLKQREMEDLYDYLLPFYKQGLDAVIVQDFGVMQLIGSCFPDLPVHISTQMSVADGYGAAYLKSLGAARIVPARELSLEEIRAIRRQTDVELECFVHGALCYCYSGQCLFSSMLGGRSGNRGRCAQPCRLPYTVLDDKKRGISKTECYPLSLKDLCTIDRIPQLIEAGIDSFKIEGRMKSAEYAAGVTALYRTYIDQYLNSANAQEYTVQPEDYERLEETGSRSGFTGGYYQAHRGTDMITLSHPGHEKNKGGYLQTVRKQYMENVPKLPVHAEASFKIGQPASLSVSCGDTAVSVTCGQTEAAKKQPMDSGMLAAQLSKTGNTPFYMDSVTVSMDDSVFLPKQAVNQLRREALEHLTNQMLVKFHRTPADCQLPNQIRTRSHFALIPDCAESRPVSGMYFTAAVETELQLWNVLEYDYISRIYLDSSMYTHKHFAKQLKEQVIRIKAAGKQAYLILPAVFRVQTAQFYKEHWLDIEKSGIDGYLAKTQDELGFLQAMQTKKSRCVLDHSLYTYSDYTKACYEAAGWYSDTIPLELNKKELLARNNTQSELIIYGYLPLMTSAQCIYRTFSKCSRTPGVCYLKDRYHKEFPVRNNCSECYNIIYNSQPLSLIQLAGELKKLHTAAYRLHFTIETKARVHQVLSCCRQAFWEGKTDAADIVRLIGTYTNGHYKRGVE